jgi:hypothetical protein
MLYTDAFCQTYTCEDNLRVNTQVVAYCHGSRYLLATPHGKEVYTHRILADFKTIGVLAAFLSEALATIVLIYFRFRTRPSTWSMRIAAGIVAVVMALVATVSLTAVVSEYGGDLAWKLTLLFVASYVPIAYIAALVGSLLIFLIDTARLRFLNFISDPPDIFFGFYWTQSRISYALIVVPVAIFAVVCLAFEITSHISADSPITLSVPTANTADYHAVNQFDHYQITKPLLFRLNEPKLLTVEHSGDGMRPYATCTLSSPGFELESIDANSMHSLPKGRTAELPVCIWLATARVRGSQKLILRVSPFSTHDSDTRPDSPYLAVYVETAHVVGEPFTMHTMLVVVLLTGLLVGLLRLARTDGTSDTENSSRTTAKRERRKIEIEEVSNLYEGETKIE